VSFDVMLGRLLCVLCCVQVVAMRQVSVMAGSFVETFLVVAGCFAVMTRSVLVMLRCLLMMMRCFMRHREFLSSCRHACGTRGLS
jgi:hypothetical protein